MLLHQGFVFPYFDLVKSQCESVVVNVKKVNDGVAWWVVVQTARAAPFDEHEEKSCLTVIALIKLSQKYLSVVLPQWLVLSRRRMMLLCFDLRRSFFLI